MSEKRKLYKTIYHAYKEDKEARLVGWLIVLRINVDLAIFQPYIDLEVGDNQSLKIQVARPGIEPHFSCSASQELNHSATAAPQRSKTDMTKMKIYDGMYTIL